MQESIKKMQNNLKYLIENIVSYIEYLKNDCKLEISIHFNRSVFSAMPQEILQKILPYNSHTNLYCTFVKRKSRYRCLDNQKVIFEKCKSGVPFYNTCYAGCYEYIYPVFEKRQAVGFVALSGYRQQAFGGVYDTTLWETELAGEEIPQNLCAALVPPLVIMLERLLQTEYGNQENEYNLILQFLNEYYCDITLSDLSRHFNRSISHISHLFKKESGVTIRTYCNNLKLDNAANLLLKTDKSVTEIAYDTGFNDASYFIYLFKEKFGKSPLKYRNTKNQNL